MSEVIRKNRALRRKVLQRSRKEPDHLRRVSPDEWPDVSSMKQPPFEIWRSRDFLVQVFNEYERMPGLCRITVQRAAYLANGLTDDDISWDELQQIKLEVGFARRDAVEIYPEHGERVMACNMRHLWVLPDTIEWKWSSSTKTRESTTEAKLIWNGQQ